MTSGGRDASNWGLFNVQTESKKGQPCDIKPILCQEGWCNECQIYLDFKGHERTMGRDSVNNSNWRGNDKEICLRCGADRMITGGFLQGTKTEKTMAWILLNNCPGIVKVSFYRWGDCQFNGVTKRAISLYNNRSQ